MRHDLVVMVGDGRELDLAERAPVAAVEADDRGARTENLLQAHEAVWQRRQPEWRHHLPDERRLGADPAGFQARDEVVVGFGKWEFRSRRLFA